MASPASVIKPLDLAPQVRMPTHRDRAEVVTTFVIFWLLLVSLSITIYYAVYPIAPMVHITAERTVSLPILISSGVGIGCTMVLLIQAYRKNSLFLSYSRWKHACIRNLLHIGHRSTTEKVESYRKKMKKLFAL